MKPMSFRRRPILGSAIAALATAITLVIVAVAPGATVPRWIVFSAHPNGSGPLQLFRIQTTGTGLDQISTGRLPAIAPSFSPDGKRIVFARLGSGIFSVNLDGTGLRRLTTNVRDTYPAWSPDGKRIVFVRPYQSQWRLYTMSASGNGERLLRAAPPAGRPSWAPDGKAILIPSGADLVWVDPQTGRVLKYSGLTLDVQTSQTAAVSHDTRRTAYIFPRASTGPEDCGEGRCPQYALYVANVPAPHRARRLVNDTGAAGWSPDGKSLVFVSQGALTVRVVNTGRSTKIATDPHGVAGDSPPAWQPR